MASWNEAPSFAGAAETAEWQTQPEPDSHEFNGKNNNNDLDYNGISAENISKHAGGCYNCGEDGHNKSDCPNPRVERAFDGVCHNCNNAGHRSIECDQPRKPRGEVDVYPPDVKDMSSEDAWDMLVKADMGKDLDGFREAIHAYTKATPAATFLQVEQSLREAGGKIFLIAKEQKIEDTHTIVNLQGQIDQKYTVSFQFGTKPTRAKFAGGWPTSVEENIQRLAEAGYVRDRKVPKCGNCDEMGHGSRQCPQERVERERVEIFCNNCKEKGHRLRDCPQPRIDPNTCRNCQQTGHRSNDCPEREKRTCRNCGEEDHVAKDCPAEVDPSKMQCRNCDDFGHGSRDCPKPRDYSRVKCNVCEQMGHTKARCPEQKRMDDEAAAANGGGGGSDSADAGAYGGDDGGAFIDDAAPVVSVGGW